ncbi:MAG: hypothetical protein R6X22_11420 [Gemmatimonadota bacterium]
MEMKLIVLTYLEGDEGCVDRLLREANVAAYSQLSIEGHAEGAPVGWYAEAAPYRSRMVFTFVGDEVAERILSAVRGCTGVEDPRHPIRAFELNVGRSAACGCPEAVEAD